MFNIAVPGNNNYEIMKFKDFQIPKFSRPYSVFKDFTGSGNMGTFSSTLRKCSHPEVYCGHLLNILCKALLHMSSFCAGRSLFHGSVYSTV